MRRRTAARPAATGQPLPSALERMLGELDARRFDRAAIDIPLLLELRPNLQAVAVERWLASVPGVRPTGPSPVRAASGAWYATVLVDASRVGTPALRSRLAVDVQRLAVGLPRLRVATPRATAAGSAQPVARLPTRRAGAATAGRAKSAPLSPRAVLAVIDDSLAFAHERLRTPSLQSRLANVWWQDAAPVAGGAVPFGREVTGAEITQWLQASVHAGQVDEDEVYARAALEAGLAGPRFLARRASHGMHVADLAAGAQPGEVDGAVAVLGVVLRHDTVFDTAGGTLEPMLDPALWFIRQRVAALGTRLPIVVNLSFGLYAGPHDGGSVLECMLQAHVDAAAAEGVTLRIVLPTGNHRQHRTRAVLTLPAPRPGRPQRARALKWRIAPDNRAASALQLWLPAPVAGAPAAGTPAVEVQVTDPAGVSSSWLASALSTVVQLAGGACTVDSASHWVPGAGAGRRCVEVRVAPTARVDGLGTTAAAGAWRVAVRNAGTKAISVDAWVQRGDTPFGWPQHGRQSWLDDAQYQAVDPVTTRPVLHDPVPPAVVRRAGALNAAATARDLLVVGAFRRDDGQPSAFSGMGLVPALAVPPAARADPTPDAAATGEDSAALPVVLAAGTRSSSVVGLRGSSMAAPQVTRWLVEQLAAGKPGTRAAVQVEAAAQDGLHYPPLPPLAPSTVPNALTGAGRMAFHPLDALTPPLPLVPTPAGLQDPLPALASGLVTRAGWRQLARRR